MGKVIRASGAVAEAYLNETFAAGPQPEIWITTRMGYDSSARAFWDSVTSGYLLWVGTYLGVNDAAAFIEGIGFGPVWVLHTGGGAQAYPAAEAGGDWHTYELHYVDDGTTELYIDGTLASTHASSHADTPPSFIIGNYAGGGVFDSDPASVVYFDDVKAGTTRGGSDLFSFDPDAGSLGDWSHVIGDVTLVDDPFVPPPELRVYADLPWRGLLTDTNSGTLTVLDHRSTGTEMLFTLGAPASCTGQVAADDPEINLPYPDADSPAYLTNNRRLLYMLRREPPASDLIPPYVCRFGGIVMSVEDEAGDAPTTRFVAYDPWQLLMNRPVRDPATGDLPGENGLTFKASDNWRWNEIITNLLDISLVVDGEHHIETFGTSYPLVEECDIIASDVTFSQGLSLGEAWQQMVDTGYVEILLPPIYDPFGSPGKVTQIQVAPKVGSLKADVIMGWDIGGNTVTDISRLIDGTRLANRVAYFAGQVAAPIQSDAASRAAYGDYFSQQHFPDQTDVTLVAAMAFAQLTLRKNGAKTLNFGPAPERSDLVLRDYGLGDYLAVWASRNLRDPIHINYDDFDPDNPGACGYQRVFSVPIQVDNNGVTKVVGIATADERAGGSV